MPLPNLFIPGASKAGTSYLGSILSHHPDICAHDKKESRFFSQFSAADEISRMDVLRYELTGFSHYAGERYLGDFDPTYMHMQKHPRCIPEIVGAEARAIILLRSPARRAFSDYHHSHLGLRIDRPFTTYLVSGNLIFDRSLYAAALRRLFDGFGRERCFLLIFEKFIGEHFDALIQQMWNFLDLPPLAKIPAAVSKNPTASNQLRIEKMSAPPITKSDKPRSRPIEPIYMSLRNGHVTSVHRAVSDANVALLEQLKTAVTSTLSEDEERTLNRKLFYDDIRRTADEVGHSLDFWL